MDDLLIRGGHVIDGTGAPARDADVSVDGGRIVAVESRASRPARRVIDARGQVVARQHSEIRPGQCHDLADALYGALRLFEGADAG